MTPAILRSALGRPRLAVIASLVGITLASTDERWGSVPGIQAKEPPPGIVDIERFGARPNDGLDDTRAIQRALDRPGSREVVIGRGSYLVSGIVVRRPVRLHLARAARLVLANESNRSVVSLASPRASLVGGVIDGSRAGQSNGRWRGAIEVTADDVEVRGVRVSTSYGIGILVRGANRALITESDVRKSGNIGIFAEAVGSVPIRGLTLIDNVVDRIGEGVDIQEGGIKVHGVDDSPARVDSVLVKDNIVRMPVRPRDQSAIGIELWGNVRRGRVVGNRTYGGSMGISLDNTVGRVENNVVSAPGLFGIELASSTRSTVYGNTVMCQGVTSKGIVLANQSPTSNRIAFNTVSACIDRGIQANGGSDGLAVIGNTVIGPSAFLVEVIASRSVIVSGNELDGIDQSGTGIVIDEARQVAIEGNRFCRIGKTGVRIYADSNIVLDGIVIEDNVFHRVQRPLSVELSGGATLGPGVVIGPNERKREPCPPA